MGKKIRRVRIVDDDLQPGDHIASHHPHPIVVNVLHNPYRGRPVSVRKKFLLYLVLPVVGTAILLAIVLAADLGLL